jgi:two-component system NtrC family sensor kinase
MIDKEGIPKVHKNLTQPTIPVLAKYTNGKALTAHQSPEMVVCESENKFRRFVEYIPAAVAMVDREMRYLAVSRRWQKDYGNSSYDVIGDDHRELFPNLPDIWWKNAEACLAGILPECELETFIIPNGKIEWVKWIFQPWYDNDGAIGGLILFTEEITESKHLEETLQLTQFAMDHAADAVFWMTSNGQLCYVNEAACKSLQYSRSELLDLSIHDIDPELSVEAWPNHWHSVKQKGSFTFESRRETKKGRSFPVEVTVNYLEFNGTEYHCAFARDITERKAAQAALLDAKGQLQAVLDAVPGLVSWVSSDLRYLGVNKHLAAAYKLPTDTFVGRKVGFLETSPRFNDLVYEFFASPDWASSKEVTATVKGESRTYLIVAQKYHQGKAAVFVGLEITDRQRMESALRRSEEKYRALTRNFPNGAVFLFDPDLRFTLAEGTELEKIGLSKQLMEGRTLFEVFPSEVSRQMEPQYRAALTGKSSVSEITFGNQIYLEHTLPLINEHGEVFAGMTMTQNITERKQVLLALQESEDRFRQQAAN